MYLESFLLCGFCIFSVAFGPRNRKWDGPIFGSWLVLWGPTSGPRYVHTSKYKGAYMQIANCTASDWLEGSCSKIIRAWTRAGLVGWTEMNHRGEIGELYPMELIGGWEKKRSQGWCSGFWLGQLGGYLCYSLRKSIKGERIGLKRVGVWLSVKWDSFEAF